MFFCRGGSGRRCSSVKSFYLSKCFYLSNGFLIRLTMIVSRTFRHHNTEYPFNWAKERYEHAPVPRNFYGTLARYYKTIMEGNLPHDLFENPNALRCSSFKLKGLPKGAIKDLSIRLINDGFIHVIRPQQTQGINANLARIPQTVQDVYETFAREHMNQPGHNPVLMRILIQNPNALSTETPIWSTVNTPPPNQKTLFMDTPVERARKMCPLFTGHIDLVAFDEQDESLVIADYKPERQYLRSLPQVAFYGLYMKYFLKVPKVKCMSFSKEDAWIYDPEILRYEIPQILESYGSPQLEWQPIIAKLQRSA
jgi:hypothetical protein